MTATRRSMELISKQAAGKDIKFNSVDGRANDIRKGLKDALDATDQEGAFQKMGDHTFETVFQKGEMCNFPITLVKYKGEIPAVGTGAAHKVPEATYMFFEPQWEWNKKYLTHNFVNPDKRKGVVIASLPDSYPVTDYFYQIPESVMKSSTYKDMYMQKYKHSHPEINANYVLEEFYALKCNAAVSDQIDYNEHCKLVHGIKPMNLKQETNIAVDSKIPFKLDNAMNIEDLGTEDHWAILGTWFTKGVASEILTKSINKAATDIIESRSRELLNQITEVTAKTFSGPFIIHLRKEVGDIQYAFTAKWSHIENAFFAALGKEQVVTRYNNFYSEDNCFYGGKPMEQIISETDTHVDKCFGRDASNSQFRLGKKYELIFIIARNIPAEFKQMKNYIQLTSGTALNEIHTAKSITEYMQTLTDKFEEKGILRDYKRGCIPAHKKSKPIEANKVSLDNKTSGDTKSRWKKVRKSIKEDNDFKKKLKDLANEIAKDTTKHDNVVYKEQAIKNLCEQEKVRACRGCGSINCYLWRAEALKDKNPKENFGSCNGIAAKFGDLSKYANEFIPKQVQGPKGNHATAAVKPATETHKKNYDSDGDVRTFNRPSTKTHKFGFIADTNSATLIIENADSESEDDSICDCTSAEHECGGIFTCPICKSKEEFDLENLIDHILDIHDVDMYCEDYSFKEARKEFRNNPQKFASHHEKKESLYLPSDDSSGSSKNRKQFEIPEVDSDDASICSCTSEEHECGGIFKCPICETSRDYDECEVFNHIFGVHEVDIYDPDFNFKQARLEYRQNPKKFLRLSKEEDGSLYLSSDNSTTSQNQKKQKRKKKSTTKNNALFLSSEDTDNASDSQKGKYRKTSSRRNQDKNDSQFKLQEEINGRITTDIANLGDSVREVNDKVDINTHQLNKTLNKMQSSIDNLKNLVTEKKESEKISTCGNGSKITSLKEKIDKTADKVQKHVKTIESYEKNINGLQKQTIEIVLKNETKVANIGSSVQDLNLKVEQNKSELNSGLTELSKKLDILVKIKESNIIDTTSPNVGSSVQDLNLKMEQNKSELKSEVTDLSKKLDVLLNLKEAKNIEIPPTNVGSSIQDLNLKVDQNKAELKSELREMSKKLELLLQSKNSDNIELPPPSGHTISNVEIIRETDTHFNPVVKRKIKETVTVQSTHNLFSVGDSASDGFRASKQSSNRSWDTQQRVDTPKEKKKDIITKEIHKTKGVIKLPNPTKQRKKQHNPRTNKGKKRKIKPSANNQNWKSAMIDFIIHIFYALNHIMKTLGKVINSNKIWTTLIIILAQSIITNGAPLGGTNQPQNMDNNPKSVLSTIHQIHQIRMETIETRVEDIMNSASAEVEANCEIMAKWEETCRNNISTCKTAKLGIQSSRNAISIISGAITSLGMTCGMNNVNYKCNSSNNWEETNSVHSFHKKELRSKRFLASLPITTYIATGLLIDTNKKSSVATARKSTPNPSEEQELLGTAKVTNLEESLSAQTTANFRAAETLRHKIKFGLDRNLKVPFKDPEAETWFKRITNTIARNPERLTKNQIKEMARLTANLATVTTSIGRPKENLTTCRALSLIHTIAIPIIQVKTTEKFTYRNGRPYANPGSNNSYTLISKGSIFSTPTTLFGKRTQIIGRSCNIDKTIHGTAISSNNYLLEKMNFTFKGTINITKSCHVNGKVTTSNQELTSNVPTTWPIYCAISSKRINCGSIEIQSMQSSKITK